MGGGGGGFFGTILNVISFAVPALRPFAIAVNMINSAANNNPIGMLSAGIGASGYFGGDSGWSPENSYGMGDPGQGGYTLDGSGSNWDQWVNDAPIADIGDVPEYTGFDELKDQISNGGAQDAAGRAVEYAKQQGILAGNGDVAGTTLDNLYGPQYNISALKEGLNLGTSGGYEAAGNTVHGLNNIVKDAAAGVGNMNTGLMDLGSYGGTTTDVTFNPTVASMSGDSSAIGTGSGIPSQMNPDMTGGSSGNYTGGTQPTTLEGINTSSGGTAQIKMGGGEGFHAPNYDYSNKDFFTGKDGTGYKVDPSKTDMYNTNLVNQSPTSQFNQGLEMNNLPDIYKKLTTPIGTGNIRTPTPLEWGGKVAGGLANMYANRQAMDVMKQHFNAANNWTDPNRDRGNFANAEWQKNQSDPMYGYDTFMSGAGRDFTDKARAAAAKSGNRGGYLNSGRMNSDLASLWQKNQSQRADSLRGGFANGVNNYAATASAAPGYANMLRNQYSTLGDLFGQYERYNQMSGE